jgi:glycosyltransferase involved in cell wall biosynthesis
MSTKTLRRATADGRTSMPVALEVRVVRGSGGGPDKTILNSPRFLAAAGYETLCAYMHPPGDPGIEQLRAKAQRWQAPFLSIPDRGPLDWTVIPQLLGICRRKRVAIWHGHDYKSNALGLLLSRFWRMRLVTTVHGWVHYTKRTPLYFWIDRRCLPHYESVICVSEDLWQRCLECGVPQERCVLIENAIDTIEYSRSLPREEAKRRLGTPAGRFLLGAAGRLSAEKGLDVLVRSVHQLIEEGRDLELVIVGEGEEKNNLKALIAELGVGERVRLLGYRGDLKEVYQALDLFVLSSLREGLPNVLLEAMSLEVPVVATRIAGVPRLVRDGESGLLVEPGSPAALAAGIRQFGDDQILRERAGRAARRTIEAGYSFQVRMDKVRSIYDRLLGGPRAAPSTS